MGLGFDLTRQAPDITPVFLKALSDGFYCERNGNAQAVTVNGVTVDVTDYYEYDASGLFSGSYIALPTGLDAEFATNVNASNQSGERLVAFKLTSSTTVTKHGLYQWYQDDNNYERLYIDVTGAGTGNLIYDVKVAGVNIYNISRAITVDLEWHVYQVHFSEQTVSLLQDGTVLGATATNATAMTFVGIEFDIGRCRQISVAGYHYASGKFDLFLIRRGLMFSNTHTGHPTTPAWSKMYCNGNTIVKPASFTLAADSINNLMPEIYPQNVAPQNVPDFCEAGDKLYIVGITPNKKVFVAKPSVAPEVALTAVNTINIGGPWEYAVSFFDPNTGEESQLSPWSDPITDNGANDINVAMNGEANRNRTDAVRAPNKKLYRRDANGVVYYVGMYSNNPATTPDTQATANLTVATNTVNTEDFYAIDSIGLSKVTSVVVTDNGTATTLAAGTYEYAVSLYDPILGVESGIVVSNQFTVAVPANDAPLITITHSVAIPTHLRFRVYRREVNTQQLYYALQLSTSVNSLTDQQISASPQTYVDTLYVQSGLTVIDSSYDKPAACNHIEYHQSRLFYANFSGEKNKVMFTDPDRLDLVRELSSFYVDAAGRPITGMKSFLNNLIIFKENSIWRLTGDTPADYELERVPSDTGCISHRTIKVIDNLMIFVGHRGIYIYDGNRVYPVFDQVSDIFRDLCHRQKFFMSAAVDQENGQYLLSYRYSDAPDTYDSNDTPYYNNNNDKILVFNYRDWLKNRDDSQIFTEWPLYTSCLGEGKLFLDSINRVVFLNLMPQTGTPDISGVRSGFGYFDHLRPRDLGNKTSDLINFVWLGTRVTIDANVRNKLAYLSTEVAVEDLTTSVLVNFGFQLDGVNTTTQYTLSTHVDNLTKRIASKNRFIAPYINGNVNERFQFVNITLRAERLVDR